MSWFMKSFVESRFKQLEMELSDLQNRPKRTQYANHKSDLAKLEGQVNELRYLLAIWTDVDVEQNVIEQ